MGSWCFHLMIEAWRWSDWILLVSLCLRILRRRERDSRLPLPCLTFQHYSRINYSRLYHLLTLVKSCSLVLFCLCSCKTVGPVVSVFYGWTPVFFSYNSSCFLWTCFYPTSLFSFSALTFLWCDLFLLCCWSRLHCDDERLWSSLLMCVFWWMFLIDNRCSSASSSVKVLVDFFLKKNSFPT